MTTKLGGVTIADPVMEASGIELRAVDVGAVHDLADGSIKYDYVTTRYQWTLRWKAITGAERSAIIARYLVKTSQSFEPPNGSGPFTVLVVGNSWRDGYYKAADGVYHYDCELQLMEVA